MNAPDSHARPTRPALPPGLEGAAKSRATQSGLRLVNAMEEESGLAPADFVAALGERLGCDTLDMKALNALAPGFDAVEFSVAARREFVPLRSAEGGLVIALADPFDAALQAWLDEQLAEPYRWAFAHHDDIAAYLNRYEESLRAMDGVLSSGRKADSAGGAAEELSLKSISTDTSPVVRLVNSTLYDALKTGASDIHLEPRPNGLSIKYRVDGVLASVGTFDGIEFAQEVISRIKVLAEADIAERRLPHDGRFKVSYGGRDIDIRVSTMPSIFGEGAVLRILDKQALADEIRGLRLDSLGFDASTIAQIRSLSNMPHGMLLVTGPTGSGKTTTLYAALTEINHGLDKIITIEDPVEYQLPGVLQIPVNDKAELTFARGLRSILRHDPDKVMVGEIRDSETAEIAVQAALTGHLVFTTVHANNVFDVIGRFVHMRVDPHSFVSALNGVVAQRLVRMICPQCSRDDAPDAKLLALSGIDAAQTAGYRFRSGEGCGQCRGTGYKGRRAIAEILLMNDELRDLIAERAPIRTIKEAARRQGVRLLREAGLDMVRRGETTLVEANRVTMVA